MVAKCKALWPAGFAVQWRGRQDAPGPRGGGRSRRFVRIDPPTVDDPAVRQIEAFAGLRERG